MFLVNSRLMSLAVARLLGQALSLSYGRCIAEFLNKGSLVRLRLLDVSTCVGLRYGPIMPSVNILFWAPHKRESDPPEGFTFFLRNGHTIARSHLSDASDTYKHYEVQE